MSTAPMVDRDERTLAVENAGYRWSYLFLSFGLLILVAYRGYFYQEAAWDLLGLVILGGLVGTAYQWTHRVLTRKWLVVALLTAVIAAAVAAATVWVRG